MSSDFLQPLSCPVCKNTSSRIKFPVKHTKSNVLELLEINSKDTTVDIVQCTACGHHYMTPVINDALMTKYYSILNSEFYLNEEVPDLNHNSKEYKSYFNSIQSIKKSGKVLEIGCGNGFLLKLLQDKGYECFGVEPSPKAYNFAKNKLGLNVENSFLATSTFYNTKFDVVILIDVVEHITDMENFMKEVTHVLNDDALIFIGTGNIESANAKIAGSNWGYFLSWEHVSFFSPASIKLLLEKNNFKNISVHKTSLQHKPGQNIFEFIKNLGKRIVNPFFKNKYYHGISFDHLIVTGRYSKK